MAGLADFRLRPNERWVVGEDDSLEKVPLNASGFTKLGDWLAGVSRFGNIMKAIGRRLDKMDVVRKKQVEALLALKESIDLCYSRRSSFALWFDHKIRNDTLQKKKEQLIDTIYEKIRIHFFGPDEGSVIEREGDWKDRERDALDTVARVLIDPFPSGEDLKELDEVLSFLQPKAGQRRIWYTEIANLGYATARYRLAQLYEYGIPNEVKPQMDNALRCYEEAVTAGSVPAILRLERAYRLGDEGLHIKQDKSKAHEWAMRASERSDAAALQVCLDFLEGIGVEPNRQEAQTRLLKLVDSGTREFRAKAAFYASQNTSENEVALDILVTALNGCGVLVEDDIDLNEAFFKLAKVIEKSGDPVFARHVFDTIGYS